MSVIFTVSMPGRIGRFMALSRAERREVYKGWWLATKKEAKHYWVSLVLLKWEAGHFCFLCLVFKGNEARLPTNTDSNILGYGPP